jgi:hypothetical protein
MNRMQRVMVAWVLLLGAAAPAVAEWSIGFSVGSYPQMQLVPGYPVYYSPAMSANYFFYDGAYWAYEQDGWYTSSWYNGPWDLVDPYDVPVQLLQVPVRYYRQPPVYFGGWRADAPPRWGEHWGDDWSHRRGGWDRRERDDRMRAAPLPDYQRQYDGARYPNRDAQRPLQERNYHYQPHTGVAHQDVPEASTRSAPVIQRDVGKSPRARTGEPVKQAPQPKPAVSPRQDEPRAVQPPLQRRPVPQSDARTAPAPRDRGRTDDGATNPRAQGNHSRGQGREQGRQNEGEQQGNRPKDRDRSGAAP